MSNKGTTNVKLGVDDKKLKKGLKKSETHLKKFGGTVKKLAGIFVGLFAFHKLFQGIKKLITLNAEFGQSLANLSAITGAVGGDLQFYEQQAKLIGKTTMLSAVQAVKAFELMGSARPELLKNKEALAAVTREAVILAEASGMELEPATKALANAMNQFSADASEASKFINAIAAGSKVGAGNIEYLSIAIEKSGTTLSMMNLSIEDNVALIETVAPFYAQAALAGNSLDKVFLKIKEKGIGYTNGIFNLNDALNELRLKYESGESAASIFGVEHAKMGELLVQNHDKLKEYTKGVTGINIAYEQQAITVDTIKGKWKLFVSAIENAILKSGKFRDSIKKTLTSLTEKVPEIINGIIGIINKFIEWRNKNIDIRLSHKITFAYIKIGLIKLKKEWSVLLNFIRFGVAATTLAIAGEFGKIGDSWEEITADNEANAEINKARIIKIYKDLLEDIENIDKKWGLLEYVTGGGAFKGEGAKAEPVTKDRGLVIPTPLAGTGINLSLVTDQLASVEGAYQAHAWALMKIDKEVRNERLEGLQEYLSMAASLAGAIGDLWANQKEKELSMVGDNAKAREAIERKYAKREQKIALGKAAINTALAITKVLYNPFLIGLASAAGALQMATIASQKFALGGAVSGPTLAMVGEAPNVSRSNPEFIGTSSQLSKMGLGGGNIKVEDIIITGDQLRIIFEANNRIHSNSY